MRFNRWMWGRNANTWDSLLYYNCFYGKQEKLLVRGLRLSLVPCDSPSMENLCGFLLVRFLCGLFPNVCFSCDCYSVQHQTAFLAVVAFFPNFVLIFYFFQSGWSVLWPSKIFQTLELFSHVVHFNKTNLHGQSN